jgi:hypothetical protein
LRRFCSHSPIRSHALGAGIGLMMWVWISSIVILFGAQLNSETEHQTARDTTVEQDKPLGRRGAAMADTIGKAAEQDAPTKWRARRFQAAHQRAGVTN